jgi:hypothetical protein
LLHYCPLIYVFARKNMERCRLCPEKYGAMQTLPREIMEPLFFGPQNYKTFILCPQNYGATQTLASDITET